MSEPVEHPQTYSVGVPDNKSDPTELTTSLVWREVLHLKEFFESRIGGIEKAVEVAHSDLVRVPTEVQKAVQTLKDLHGEKFNSIQTQFEERDVRVEQTARDTKTAVDAALAAQEKAVGKQNETFEAATSKSESAFTKQIDQQAELLRTEVRGLREQMGELKDRLNRGEGRGEGVATYRTDHRAMSGTAIAIIAICVTVILGVAGIIIAELSRR